MSWSQCFISLAFILQNICFIIWKGGSHPQPSLTLSVHSYLFKNNPSSLWTVKYGLMLYITASKNWYGCGRIWPVPQRGIRQSLDSIHVCIIRYCCLGSQENMRLPWQHRLFEGRYLGRVVGSFEVLGVLIGKDPLSNKQTAVGQQSRKISI